MVISSVEYTVSTVAKAAVANKATAKVENCILIDFDFSGE